MAEPLSGAASIPTNSACPQPLIPEEGATAKVAAVFDKNVDSNNSMQAHLNRLPIDAQPHLMMLSLGPVANESFLPLEIQRFLETALQTQPQGKYPHLHMLLNFS